jgi:hypothetical protein
METPTPNRNHETMLALGVLLALGASFVVFVTTMFGVLGNVLFLMVLIAAVGYFHYYLWGHGMSEKTAAEREEERRQQLEAQELYHPPPHQRF